MGSSFWAEIEEYQWFTSLYKMLQNKEGVKEIVFLTSPSYDPSSACGKLFWLKSRFGRDFTNYVLTSRKELLASPNVVLIDDLVANVNAFRKAGGHAILFPMVWNVTKLIDIPEDRVIFVEAKLYEMEKKGLLNA